MILDDIKPNAALTSATATAIEDGDGFDSSWKLSAYAICADPPPGLELVAASSEMRLRGGHGRDRALPGRQEPARHRRGADRGLRPVADRRRAPQRHADRKHRGRHRDRVRQPQRLGGDCLSRSVRIPEPRILLASALTLALLALAPTDSGPRRGGRDPSASRPLAGHGLSAKGVNSTCPAGKRALGVGGRIVTSTRPGGAWTILTPRRVPDRLSPPSAPRTATATQRTGS